jgi:SAM-dependent methyltransferase
VTGVDRTKLFLDRAKQKAGNLAAEWVLADARTFVRPQTYDLAINLFTSFGYFEDPAEDEMVARNLAQSLKPGGKLVMQLIGKEVAGSQFVAREWQEDDDMILLEERHIVPPYAAIDNRWTIIRNGKMERLGFVVRLYSASELELLLLRAGFSRVRFFGALDGCPYDEHARRLVAMATRAT